MSEPTPINPPTPPPADPPAVVVTFVGPGAADGAVEIRGTVTLGMILAAAARLDAFADEVWQDSRTARQSRGLVIPTPGRRNGLHT